MAFRTELTGLCELDVKLTYDDWQGNAGGVNAVIPGRLGK
jgi:hypothetical protein